MNPLKKAAAYVLLGGVGAAGFAVTNTLVKDVQFTRAEAKVEASREALERIEDFASVYKAVGRVVEPSVVSLQVQKTIHTAQENRMRIPEEFRRFLPDRDGDGEPDMPEFDMPEQFEQTGTGSGVIMDVDGSHGYILTNNHVAGGAQEITVTFSDGREITKAKVIGSDPKSDLAVVRVEADRLIPAKWGDSDNLEKGDIVMAFGSPFGYVGSMTHGIVSALNRQAGILGNNGYEDFVQVDAPINPGNSGGPLVNIRGEVIGINTAIASRTGAFNGIGFAIPSNQAKQVYSQLKEKGKVVRGYIGVGIKDVSASIDLAQSFGYEGETGVLVHQIFEDTPATGILEAGDIITAINGKPVRNSSQLRNIVAGLAPNEEATFTISRGGKSTDVKLKIGEQPDDMDAIRKSTRPSLSKGEGGKSDSGSVLQNIGLKVITPTQQHLTRFGLEADLQGALVTSIEPRSLAGKAGFVVGDLITKVGGVDIASIEDLNTELAGADLEKGVRFYVVNREGARFIFVKSAK